MKTLLSLCPWLPGVLLLPSVTLAQIVTPDALLGSNFDSYEAPAGAGSDGEALLPEPAEPAGELTLRDAVAAALLGNPQLASFSWEVRANEARVIQASFRPNPQLSLELENLGGSGDRAAFDQTETTVWLSQLVELAGKRPQRRRVAELQTNLAQWDYEATRLGILTATTKAFVTTLAAQRRLSLAQELERIARASIATVAAQVDAGAVPIVERTRAEVVSLTAELARKRVERELAASRVVLAASWGGTDPLFTELRGDLSSNVDLPPPLTEIEERIEANPDVARWHTILAISEASVSLERANRVPNPTVAVGGRHFSDNGDGAFVLGISVPLPLADRNQGRILAARRALSRTRADQATARLSARSAVAARYQDLVSAFEQAVTLREQTLPAAKRAFEGTDDGYRKGLFRYLDVLDAQRTLFELRARELEALAAFHQARADIEQLINSPLYAGGSFQ